MSKKVKSKEQAATTTESNDKSEVISEALLKQAIDIQSQIEKIYEDNKIKVLEIEKKYQEKLKPHYEKRDKLIETSKGLDNFWSQAISKAMIDNFDTLDQEVCDAITLMEVKVDINTQDGSQKKTLTLHFKDNSVFSNKTLSKTIQFKNDGQYTSESDKVQYKSQPDTKKNNNNNKNQKKRKELEKESFLLKFIEFNEDPESFVDIFEDLLKIYEDPFSMVLDDDEDDDEEFDEDADEGDSNDDN
ncbi:nucleosome assembly family protein [Tieghemostelium lacteum]|uniref:Nucleosome assembly family protein n=1 Tax=Tieghemostelium lacteum TaxID=361077 RepID=A0A152A7H1_TIELA|nr:nucleosome assembly family protein [Tieghemostelium lacteum]|eukprot:KYR02158.1 nucleosome assembly family protein [Tieghemostelium lacteum]